MAKDRQFGLSVAVFVVHYGDPERSVQALASCRGLDPGFGALFLIDNSGNWPLDDTGDYRVLRPGRNLGYAGAVNLAADAAHEGGFDYLWVLNNDVTVAEDALQHFAQALAAHPEADIVGSYVSSGGHCYYGGGGFNWRTGRPWHLHFGVPIDTLPRGGAVTTDWINGASMLIPVSAILTRGRFDENLFLYKEELEWQLRTPAARAVLVRECLVDHEVGATTGSTAGALGGAFMARNALLIAGQRRGLSKWRWRAEAVLSTVLYPLLAGNRGQVAGALIGVRLLTAGPAVVVQRIADRGQR